MGTAERSESDRMDHGKDLGRGVDVRDDRRDHYELAVISGPDCGRTFELSPGRHIIGASPTCGMCVTDPSLASRHATLTWRPPELDLELFGDSSDDRVGPSTDRWLSTGRFRLGRSTFEVKRRVPCEDDTSELKVLHRHPVDPQPELIRPQPLVLPEEPSRAHAPGWNTLITGIVTGVAIASFSGHWYFALFSVVTGVVTCSSWTVQLVRSRRRRRRWRTTTTRLQEQFHEQCNLHAVELARRRRSSHPSMIDIRDEVTLGRDWLWHQRTLERVSIGYGARALRIDDGSPLIEVDDVPVLIDVSPGTIVGVHGSAAARSVAAIVVRMAASCGPSDWNMTIVGTQDPILGNLQCLPHVMAIEDTDDFAVSIVQSRRHLVLVVTESRLVSRTASVMRIFEAGRVTMLVMAEHRSSLPSMCTVIVDADDRETDGIASDTARALCSAISRWVDPDEDGSGVALDVDFLDLFPGGDLTAVGILEMWRAHEGSGPRAVLGRGAQGTVGIDLDVDGPHAVVIGTTGSGKSEFLRLLVASIACHSSPQDVAFVLIDYKGGSAFDECSQLPHVVGVITDLDAGMATRVLAGLEAESKRREMLLRSARVGDIGAYHRTLGVSAHDHRGESLPRLVIVIDELAALRAETPEFVSTLAAIAQRGRSLGLHLVVATQRSAALSADVMANASIRVALRVQSTSDSLDVVGTDRAAFLDRSRPGKMILKVANGPAREVQCASVSTVISAVVATIDQVVHTAQLPSPRRPWTDPLSTVITRPRGCAPRIVGVTDDVMQQIHVPWSWACDGHLAILGGVGRTNALRTLIRSLGDDLDSCDVVIVSCRGASSNELGGLGILVDGSDHERLFRTLNLCERRMRDTTVDRTTARTMLLMIDDIDVWRSQVALDRTSALLWAVLERVVTSGASAGIVCVITAVREQSLPVSVLARMTSVWRGTTRAGVFRVQGRGVDGDVDVQMFWDDPDAARDRIVSDDLRTELTCLEPVVRRHGDYRSFAVRLDTRDHVSLRFDELVRFVVIGPSGSGVSSALGSLATSWRQAHPDGRIVDLDRIDSVDLGSTGAVRSDQGTGSLLIVDDVHRQVRRTEVVARVLDDPDISADLSIAVGVSPSFLRSRPEHWIHQIRRARSGVLLTSSAYEDCDLLGIHAPPAHVFRTTAGRGLWVMGGSVMGFVQFLVDDAPERVDEERDRHDGSVRL